MNSELIESSNILLLVSKESNSTFTLKGKDCKFLIANNNLNLEIS